MPPRFLQQATAVNVAATHVLAIPVGGAGVFPLGLGKTFAHQFTGNTRTDRVISLLELVHAAGAEARIPMYFIALPEWRLFQDGQESLDTPETTVNFMLYYLFVLAFPSEDAEIVFKGVLARLLAENASLLENKPVEEEDERKPRRSFIETPRIRVGKGSSLSDACTQLSISDQFQFAHCVTATGAPPVPSEPDETLANELWNILVGRLDINTVLQSLQAIEGLEYPPFLNAIHFNGAVFYIPPNVLKLGLVSLVPPTYGKDQLALFMLPGILSPASHSVTSDFDVQLIGEGENVYVTSETRGFSFKDPSKLLSPLPAICSKIFRRLMHLAPTPLVWSQVYRYCHKYMRMLFCNPYIAGFPSIYRDLFAEIDRLKERAKGDKLMAQFYGRRVPNNTSVIRHNVELVIALLHSAGLRDNHVVVALAYLSASGSCRSFCSDSDITAFTGTAGRGKSNILNMISALVNDVSQYSMDACSSRAITMPQNAFVIGGRVVGEAPQNGRITFTDDGAGTFQQSKGSRADKDGDAMKLTQASRGCITYQVINPSEDARGNKTMKLQTRVVANRGATFTAMNGNAGTDAGASRMQCYYVKSSNLAPANTPSAVCALDVNAVPDELESMFAANQLRNAEVSYYNAVIAFGLANDASVTLWQVFIVRALESASRVDYPQEVKILQSPRKVGAIVRNSLSLTSNMLFHLIETLGFGDNFLGTNLLKRYMFLQQASYVTPEIIALSLSSAMPVCNGASNVALGILRNIKDQIDHELTAPFHPKTCVRGGVRYYILKSATIASLQETIKDHMTEYEAVDVSSSLASLCKTTSRNKMQYLEKDGDRLIFYAPPLDGIFGSAETNVLQIMQLQLEVFRKDLAAHNLETGDNLTDCFPLDVTGTYLLLPQDMSYLFSRHANNDLINDLGSEFEQGMTLLITNTVCGSALQMGATMKVQDTKKPTNSTVAYLQFHFPGTPIMKNCTAINKRALITSHDTLSTSFLDFIPCFRTQSCMIATGKSTAPDIPESVTLAALDSPFIISNPHYCAPQARLLPSMETSVVEKQFFGTVYAKIQIPPGPITELYLIYMRCFTLWRQVPLTISRPDFIAHYLTHGTAIPYSTYFPVPAVAPPGVATIYQLFVELAVKMHAVGLVDEIIEHLVAPTLKRRLD